MKSVRVSRNHFEEQKNVRMLEAGEAQILTVSPLSIGSARLIRWFLLLFPNTHFSMPLSLDVPTFSSISSMLLSFRITLHSHHNALKLSALSSCSSLSAKMRSSDRASLFAADSKSKRSYLCVVFPAAGLLCVVTFVTSSFFAEGYREKFIRWRTHGALQNLEADKCKNQCRPRGSEALPQGIVSNTSDFKMRRLWDPPGRSHDKIDANVSANLFAVTAGIKQKELVNKMVQKFLASDFAVMIFHYDGIVDKWKDVEWSDQVIHVSAINQSKWWFAKRFLHPDIVADYGYIFLWDEDLGVEHFHPDKYVSIIKREGLEVSQPALDPRESEVHHQITVRWRSEVHRRTYKAAGDGKRCDNNSTAPPCAGWIEMMAPVFSRAAWRCVWYMIQSDLVHAWGLDIQLGYCAQGDRTKNVGVVDAEYIVHYNRPTLGGSLDENTEVSSYQAKDHRVGVRRRSFRELREFRKRWKEAVERDECWKDPYK